MVVDRAPLSAPPAQDEGLITWPGVEQVAEIPLVGKVHKRPHLRLGNSAPCKPILKRRQRYPTGIVVQLLKDSEWCLAHRDRSPRQSRLELAGVASIE